METVYFISGLGADERVFRHIVLPPGYQAAHLRWIAPEPGESLTHYSARLSESIDFSKPFSLVGLSMGGMIATEIARTQPPRKLILISSVPLSGALPFYYHIAGRLRLHRLVPISLLKNMSALKRLFTTETSEDKQMLRSMIRHADPAFLRWALGAILSWKNELLPKNLVHIHGSADLVLPVRYAKPGLIVQGAGHMMVLNRAAEINRYIEEALKLP